MLKSFIWILEKKIYLIKITEQLMWIHQSIYKKEFLYLEIKYFCIKNVYWFDYCSYIFLLFCYRNPMNYSYLLGSVTKKAYIIIFDKVK